MGSVALDTIALVARLAAPETTGGVERVAPDLPGGAGGNVVMALAKLGAATRLVSAVGPDFAASAYERALLAAGVELRDLVRVDELTSRAYVFADPHGAQVTYFHAGASRALARTARADVRGARCHFAAGEISVYPQLMQAADFVSFDPGQEVFHRDLDEIRACLPHVDVLFVNRHERERLKVAPGDVPVLVESRGAQGTRVHEGTKETLVPAAPAAPREPTGAGDAHRAGFVFALAKGASLENAARVASVMGAFAVEGIGPQSNLPTLAQLQERYQRSFGRWPL